MINDQNPHDFRISSSPQLFNTPQDPRGKQRPLRASSCCSSRKFSRVISLAASWRFERIFHAVFVGRLETDLGEILQKNGPYVFAIYV